MSYSSQLTRKRILKCAQQEFMEHGFQNANMRNIAKQAKATTGALYNHFANKAVLFDALVQDPAEKMILKFQQLHEIAIESVPSLSGVDMEEQMNCGTDWMLDYIYEYKDAFKLIFCYSEGTRWSNYLENLIEIEEQAYRVYCELMCEDKSSIDDMFLHITASTGFQYLVEIVYHDLPYDHAVTVMNSVKQFSIAGWKKILGF